MVRRFIATAMGVWCLCAITRAQAYGRSDAEEPECACEPSDENGIASGEEDPGLEWHVRLDNFFLFRNDSDFDRTAPRYNESGQTVGAFATILTPRLTWHLTDNLRMTYEVEIGLNYWSRNNPDTESALSPDVFVMKHREMFAEGEFFGERFGFRVGYQRLQDPTGLFLNHWIGAARVFWSLFEGRRCGVFVGQIPDQVYEGLTIRDNNFKRDILVFGAGGEWDLGRGWGLAAGVHGLYDSHVVSRTRWVVAPAARVTWGKGPWNVAVDGVLQAGRFENAALDGSDQTVLAWAAQAHVGLDLHPWLAEFNVLALSPDDAHDGNKRQGAFLSAAKPRSATRMLTEDEVRDWYDNYDERMSTFEGGFFLNRAGLFLADASVGVEVTDFFQPRLVVGAAMVLEPKNALDGRFAGLEALADLTFFWREMLFVHVVGGALFPGRAAAALVNRMDRSATDPIWMTEVSLTVRY